MVHFDFEKVKAYFDNDLVVLQSFLALLKKELPKSQLELESQFAQKNLKGLREAAHKLKGTSVSAGLPELTLLASRLNKLDSVEGSLAAELLEGIKKEVGVILPLIDKVNHF